jgi:hypothetical protein
MRAESIGRSGMLVHTRKLADNFPLGDDPRAAMLRHAIMRVAESAGSTICFRETLNATATAVAIHRRAPGRAA